jgi:Rap1a immunity proteins
MRLRFAAAGAAVVTLVLCVSASQANGVDLNTNCGVRSSFFNRDKCRIYIAGVVDAIMEMQHPNICFPRNYDMRQSVAIVQKFMALNPERLNNGPATVVRDALHAAYPCE